MASQLVQAQTTVKRGHDFKVDPALLLTKVPPPPPDLSPEGTKWWNYYGTLLVEAKMFSRMFLTALHNLCIQHILRKAVQDALNETKCIYIINSKSIKEDTVTTYTVNPLLQELRKILIDMDRLLTSLGMTVTASKAQQINTTGSGPNQAIKPPSPFAVSDEDTDLGFDVISMPLPGQAG